MKTASLSNEKGSILHVEGHNGVVKFVATDSSGQNNTFQTDDGNLQMTIVRAINHGRVPKPKRVAASTGAAIASRATAATKK